MSIPVTTDQIKIYIYPIYPKTRRWEGRRMLNDTYAITIYIYLKGNNIV